MIRLIAKELSTCQESNKISPNSKKQYTNLQISLKIIRAEVSINNHILNPWMMKNHLELIINNWWWRNMFLIFNNLLSIQKWVPLEEIEYLIKLIHSLKKIKKWISREIWQTFISINLLNFLNFHKKKMSEKRHYTWINRILTNRHNGFWNLTKNIFIMVNYFLVIVRIASWMNQWYLRVRI